MTEQKEVFDISQLDLASPNWDELDSAAKSITENVNATDLKTPKIQISPKQFTEAELVNLESFIYTLKRNLNEIREGSKYSQFDGYEKIFCRYGNLIYVFSQEEILSLFTKHELKDLDRPLDDLERHRLVDTFYFVDTPPALNYPVNYRFERYEVSDFDEDEAKEAEAEELLDFLTKLDEAKPCNYEPIDKVLNFLKKKFLEDPI